MHRNHGIWMWVSSTLHNIQGVCKYLRKNRLCFRVVTNFPSIAIVLFITFLEIIGLVGKVFINGPEDRGSIPGRVIPKNQKWYLMPPCLTLSIIRYGSFSPSSCSSYGKVSLRVDLDYGLQLLLLLYMSKTSWCLFVCFGFMVYQPL